MGDIGLTNAIRESSGSERRGRPLTIHIYENNPGREWDGSVDLSYVGRPRQPGRYLPVEVLWDPITKIRDWGPYGRDANRGYAGTEEGRDYLTRRRYWWGYGHFLHEIGCDRKEHVLTNTGHSITNTTEPYRPATRHRHIRAGALPSAWVAGCQPGLTRFGGHPRRMTSHFGVRKPLPGLWRFNMLHVDGHVDDGHWNELRSEPKYGANEYGIGWLVNWKPDASGWCDPRPYGWKWMTNPAGDRDGIEPWLDSAFDFNLRD